MPVARAKFPRVIELALMGKGPTDIGADLGCTPQVAHATLQLPEVRDQIDAANRLGLERLLDRRAQLATLGISVLAELAEGRPTIDPEDGARVFGVADAVRKGAADSLLDRMGITKETAVRVTGSTGITLDASGMTAEQLRELLGEPDLLDD